MAQAPPPTPPGWYRDNSGTTRWWDGNGWTQHTQAPTVPQAPAAWGVGAPTGAPAGFPPAYQPKRSRRGPLVIACIVVAAVLGLVGLSFLGNKANHEATAAEKVVRDFLQSNDESEASGDYVPGLTSDKSAISCTAAQFDELAKASKYRITASDKTDNGATVSAEIQSSDLKLTFHLVDDSGWKIDGIRCTG